MFRERFLMEDTNVYGIKIIYRNTVGDKTVYEESVLKIRADSFDEAYGLAEKYTKDMIDACDGEPNRNGVPVRISVAAYVDCFHMQEENDKIEEVFSTFIKNETSLSEEELLKQLTSVCSEEDMKPFLHF